MPDPGTANPDALVSTGPALSTTTDVPAITSSPVPPSGDANLVPAPAPVVPEIPAEPKRPSEPIAPRIAELTGERRRLVQMMEEQDSRFRQLAAQNTALLERLNTNLTPAPAPTPAPTAPTPPEFTEPRPNRATFADPETYETALIEWSGRRAAAVSAAELRREWEAQDRQRQEAIEVERQRQINEEVQRQRNAEFEDLRANYTTKREAAIASHEDYVQKAEYDAVVTPTMAQVLLPLDNVTDVLYWLGNNRDESVRIANLTVPGQFFPSGSPQAGMPVPDVARQAFELGRIAARLSATATSTAPNTNAAPNAIAPVVAAEIPPPSSARVAPPPPPTPISGANAAASERDIYSVANEGSMEEYAARRGPQLNPAWNKFH